MTTLDGVNLTTHGSDLRWVDRHAAQSVAQSVTETLGGGLIIYAQALVAGKNITLVADDNWGWLSKSVVDAVQLMADEPGGVFPLVIDGLEYSVMFRHHEPPAFDVQPFVPRLAELEGDYFTGTIKLITV